MGNCDDMKNRAYTISHGGKDCFKPKENQSIIAKKDEVIYGMGINIKNLKDELLSVKRERDAAIADLTELCMFYKTQTICNFCAYDSDEECKGRGGDNGYMNKCFKWRGPT